jgi:hypothetical protein
MSRRKREETSDRPNEPPTHIIDCPICHAPIDLLTDVVEDRMQEGHRTWRCPNGHLIGVEIQETFEKGGPIGSE